MRQVFTLTICLVLFLLSTAQSVKTEIDSSIIFCRKPSPKVDPVIIIDGMISTESDVKKLNPDNIQNISILKPGGVLGCNAPRPAVIITTKTANQRMIYVKDLFSGEPIAAASFELISIGSKKDTINMIADSSGKIIISKDKYENEYELKVASIGYTRLRSVISLKQNSNGHTVHLIPNHKTLEEVIVKSGGCIIGRKTKNSCSSPNNLSGYFSCRSGGIRINLLPEKQEKKSAAISINVWPNPVLRSQKMNIEFTSENAAKLNIRLCNIDGKLIVSNEYMAAKGTNHFQYCIDPKLASGVYAIQVFDQKNKLVKSEKLIIQ